MWKFGKKKKEQEEMSKQAMTPQVSYEDVAGTELGKTYLKLQNGSDIRGIACEGPNGEAVNLTEAAVRYIGMAFAGWLSDQTGKKPVEIKVGVGRDSRITGPDVMEVFMQGIRLSDACAVDCGMASTPAMFMSTVYPETNYDGGCMITASHLPFHRNGIKFFTKEGGLEKAQIREILLRAAKLEAEEVLATGTGLSPRPRSLDLITLYAANLANAIRKEIGFEPAPLPVVAEVEDETAPITRSPGEDETASIMRTPEAATDIPQEPVSSKEAYVEAPLPSIDTSATEESTKPLAGLHIVVDAGNGAGGFFVTKILDELGADTTGSQFLEPDGMFPNHEPNPENKEAMAAIVKATLDNHADLGLIFDTDVDRMSAVLSDGTPLNRDAIIAMMAAILAPENPGSTIITDSVTSDRLTDFLENDLGLKHLCFKRGYKNVIDKCKELNAAGTNSPLAMETSGHGCLKENFYLDDGAFLAVKLIAAVAKAKEKGETIDHLIASLVMECADREVRFKILEEDFGTYGTEVLTRFREKAEEKGYTLPMAYEGVRIRFDDDPTGWLLLRASLHDPVMVLNMEGKDEADLAKITEIVKELLAGEEGLDLSSL